MTTSTRRVFMLQVAAGASTLAATHAMAQAAPMLAETDPQAVALGYKADSTKVDEKKFAKHAATQNCGNCALYAGKPKEVAGACPLFAGKQVAAAGWCSAWAKKAG